MKNTKARAVALLAAGVIGGGILGGTLSATAATNGSSSTGAPSGAPAGQRPGPGGAQPVRSDEKLVTGGDLATLRAAALKAVPGGTVIRIETDSGDATYEAHMTKSDGSLVTVKFDKSLAVTAVQDGMGR